ncbi:MAG: pantetheine-phosphate adenylyltransferase [Oligoflexia bacterium]|nr:pantetheine-phosphate adenylyltransferase [Oligoflexia bacterium]
MKEQDFSHGLYPGSFDPITCGHIDMVNRLSRMFKRITVLVASSIHKEYWFSLKEREDMAKRALKHLSNVTVDKYEGLTTDYLKKNKIFAVLRGIRSVTDFPYERDLAVNNKKIFPEMETLFLFSGMGTEMVSSKWIKEIAFHKGDLKDLVPDFVEKKIKERMAKGG